MSWDVSLKVTKVVETDIGNMTYNVSKMYYTALGMEFRKLDGMKANDAIPLLTEGIKNMKEDPIKYREMNPPNGWGNYEVALSFLEDILKAASESVDENAVICVN